MFKFILPVIAGLAIAFGVPKLESRSLPTHLKVNEAEWTVRMVDEFPSDDELLGWTDLNRHEILLRKGMCLEQEQNTLWHEIHHAVMGKDFSEAKITGHQSIYILTPEEIHVMRDNPQLVRYLTK